MEQKQESKTMIFFRSIMDAVEILDDEAIKHQCYLAIFKYCFNGEEPNENANPFVKFAFKLARPSLDSSIERYNSTIENGKKGGAPLGNQNARKKDNELNIPTEITILENKNNPKTTENNPKTTQNNLYKDIDKDKDRESDKEKDSDKYSDKEKDSESDKEENNINLSKTTLKENINLNNLHTKTFTQTTKQLNNTINQELNITIKDNNTIYSNAFSHFKDIFKQNFPNKNLVLTKREEINQININNLDLELFCQKIKGSSFLMGNDNLGLEWCLLNYAKIVMGYYDDYFKTNAKKFGEVEAQKNNATYENGKKLTNKEFCKKYGIFYVDKDYNPQIDGLPW